MKSQTYLAVREEYDDYYDEVDEICKTDSGSQVNKKCKFPFIFRGTTYDTCISGSRRRQPWCSTQLDADGAYVSGKWGYCDANLCPLGRYRCYYHRKNAILVTISFHC